MPNKYHTPECWHSDKFNVCWKTNMLLFMGQILANGFSRTEMAMIYNLQTPVILDSRWLMRHRSSAALLTLSVLEPTSGWIRASCQVTWRLVWDPTCLLLRLSFPIKDEQNLKVLKSRRQYNLFLENYPAFKGFYAIYAQYHKPIKLWYHIILELSQRYDPMEW